MKTRIYKLATIALTTVLMYSCSVDNYKVEGELTEETIVKNEASAQGVLNGIYDSARPHSNGIIFSTTGLLLAGLEQQRSKQNTDEIFLSFYNNDVKPNGIDQRGGMHNFYQKMYRTINLANFFISTVEKRGIPKISEAAKNRLIAQAKVLRANSYFTLLRVFGQFYDSNSEYGVITSNKTIDGFTFLKRAKVSETYAQIISDLEYAVKYAPNRGRDIASRTFAKGLLAKVYLYKGGAENWAKTASYCKDIINNLGGEFQLVPNYESIFKESFNSKEVIFAPFYSKKEPISNPGALSFDSQVITPSKYFKEFADELVEDGEETTNPGGGEEPKPEDGGEEIPIDEEDLTGLKPKKVVVKYDPRYEFTFVKKLKGNTSFAYNKYPDVTKSTFYFLRVAEVYLMYAEAIARTDGNMQTAVNMLNTVRKRAYSNAAETPLVVFIDKATLLEDIRKEKMLELHLENAETWFDLVRYDRLGDLKISDLKPSITNPNQLIFPIPLRAIANNPNFGKQNPGY